MSAGTKFLKSVIAIAALPAVAGFAVAFQRGLAHPCIFDFQFLYFLGGIVAYFITHIFFFKPVFLYVFAHELVHAIATLLCGGKVTSFKVSSAGGSVRTSKTNFFVELSPYFVPLYTLILIFLIPVLRYKLERLGLFSIYLSIIGYTLGMHMAMNAEALKLRQPDITKSGMIFSFSLIFMANLIISVLIISILTEQVSFFKYLSKSLQLSKDYYFYIWHNYVLR